MDGLFSLDPLPFEETPANAARSGYDTLQHFSRSAEETLEMLANSLLWFLFLSNLPRVASGGLQVRFEAKRD